MARRLGIPVRTWYNYEAGVTVPAEVVLRIIELTSLEPSWLLNGKGPKFRLSASESRPRTRRARDDLSVRALASDRAATTGEGRRALADRRRIAHAPGRRSATGEDHPDGGMVVEGDGRTHPRPLSLQPGVNDGVASREWFEARRESRCIQVVGDAMSPLLSDGAYVAFARSEESPRRARWQAGRRPGRSPPHRPLVPGLRPVRPAPGREKCRGARPGRPRGPPRVDAIPARALDRHAALEGEGTPPSRPRRSPISRAIRGCTAGS